MRKFLPQEIKDILHGEAIALGMYLETELSPLNIEKKKEIQDYLKSNFNLVDCPSLEQLPPFLKNDKKNEHDNINFSLLDDIGSCSYNNDLIIEKNKRLFFNVIFDIQLTIWRNLQKNILYKKA